MGDRRDIIHQHSGSRTKLIIVSVFQHSWVLHEWFQLRFRLILILISSSSRTCSLSSTVVWVLSCSCCCCWGCWYRLCCCSWRRHHSGLKPWHLILDVCRWILTRRQRIQNEASMTIVFHCEFNVQTNGMNELKHLFLHQLVSIYSTQVLFLVRVFKNKNIVIECRPRA